MERTAATLTVPSPVTAEVLAHALREVIKFLLFVRQQMPASYDELRATLLDSLGPAPIGLPADPTDPGVHPPASPGRKRKRVSSADRAAARLFREIEATLGCLTAATLRRARPDDVILFLGATPLRPKEIFTFDLRALAEKYAANAAADAPGAARTADNAARRAIRECLPAVSASPPATSAMKAFVFLRARQAPGEGARADEAGCGNVDATVPAGFLPKRGFKPSTRQTRVSVLLEVRARTPGGVTGDAGDGEVSDGSRDANAAGDGAGDGNREGAGDGDGDEDKDGDWLWYQCATTVKGVKGS